MSTVYYIALFLFLFLSFLVCLLILVQESKSLGLGASFGGDSSDSLFGASTADVLKRFTGWMVALFLFSCVVLHLWTEAISVKNSQTLVLPFLEQGVDSTE